MTISCSMKKKCVKVPLPSDFITAALLLFPPEQLFHDTYVFSYFSGVSTHFLKNVFHNQTYPQRCKLMSVSVCFSERTEERVRRGHPGGSGASRQQTQEALRPAIDATRGRGGGGGLGRRRRRGEGG